MRLVLRCEGVEDVAPQQRYVGAERVYEDYECLIDRSNTWLRDQTDVNVVNLQSILVQKDLTGWKRLILPNALYSLTIPLNTAVGVYGRDVTPKIREK